MNDSRFALKVGMFVFVGAILVALLILNFSSGITFLNPTYSLHVILPNAAGLKPTADVMMAGVSIGKVRFMQLGDDGKTVDITVSILSKYKIHKDAQFQIDSLGFLGDQYIEVSPPTATKTTAYLQDGDTVIGEPTFDMTEAVKSISSVVEQARKTMRDLDQSITNVNNSALSTNTLAHLAAAINNLQTVTGKISGAATRADNLLASNSGAFTAAVGNFESFSERLTNAAANLGDIISTNRDDVRAMVINLRASSDQIREIATDLQNGKGPAGELLKDEKMSAQLSSIVSNANSVAAEFSIFGSNLNQKGIWAMLWKPKEEKHRHDHPETKGSNK